MKNDEVRFYVRVLLEVFNVFLHPLIPSRPETFLVLTVLTGGARGQGAPLATLI